MLKSIFLLTIVSSCLQESRLDDQRTVLPLGDDAKPSDALDDDFLNLISRVQAGRIEDQRSVMPISLLNSEPAASEGQTQLNEAVGGAGASQLPPSPSLASSARSFLSRASLRSKHSSLKLSRKKKTQEKTVERPQ